MKHIWSEVICKIPAAMVIWFLAPLAYIKVVAVKLVIKMWIK